MAIEVDGAVQGLMRLSDDITRGLEWAMRETGRAARSAAKDKAPLYEGKPRVGVVRGELHESIKSSRHITRVGSRLSMLVGPFGPRYKAEYVPSEFSPRPRRVFRKGWEHAVYGTPLYRGKEEDRAEYMAAGLAAAELTAGTSTNESMTAVIVNLQ